MTLASIVRWSALPRLPNPFENPQVDLTLNIPQNASFQTADDVL
jgi:hypothetical protein